MNRMVILSAISLMLFANLSASAAESVIVDYSCTDMSIIPQQYIESATNQFNIILFRTSHGSQITTGINSLGVAPPSITEVSDDLGYYGDTSFVQKTRDRLGTAGNPNYNIVWWAWCAGIADNTEEGINAYLQAMEGLETEYPTVTFIYATGPLWHPGDIGTKENNDARNQQIRNWIENNDDKIFFDFESFDACSPDGQCFWDTGTDACEWCYNWCSTQICPACISDCAHSNCFNCIQKGRAFWYLVARLAGWNPQSSNTADFSATPTSGTAPLAVDFTDLSTGDVTGWSWDFDNDGVVDANGQHPAYTYSNAGSYTVSLEITGPGGSDTETKNNYISVSDVQVPPAADFSGTPTSGTAPLAVDFTDLSTGDVTGWSWDFDNDGVVDANGQHPVYTYSNVGSYTVSLEVTGYGGTDTRIRSNYITVLDDSDGDGISDAEEDAGPNGGDGNNDGAADSLQNNVACFRSFDGQHYIAIESEAATTLTNCRALSNPNPNQGPDGVQFDYGFFEFSVEGLANGAATEVIIYLPQGASPDSYYKYGPTPNNPVVHWYEFLFEGVTGTQINNNIISLHFKDGARGDDDLTADGTLMDVGAPAAVVVVDTGGSGGGGCFTSVAAERSPRNKK